MAGDTAFLLGHAADYAVLMDLVKPIRTAGLPVHLALGNHDDRDNFHKAIALAEPKEKTKEEKSPVADKVVSVLETPLVNWFLLDSLKKTMVTSGVLGKAQLDWLAKALDARPKKPAIVLAHHYLFLPGGLDDSDALLEVLVPRKQVEGLRLRPQPRLEAHPLARHPLAQFARGRLGLRQIAAARLGRSEADRQRRHGRAPCLGQEASEKWRADGDEMARGEGKG